MFCVLDLLRFVLCVLDLCFVLYVSGLCALGTGFVLCALYICLKLFVFACNCLQYFCLGHIFCVLYLCCYDLSFCVRSVSVLDFLF